MTLTFDPPVGTEPSPATRSGQSETLDELRALENQLSQRSFRRDDWTIVIFGVAIVALVFSVLAIGFGVRAIDEAQRQSHAAAVSASSAPAPAPAAAVALTSVMLNDMKVIPSSTSVPAGKYTINVTNAGMMLHELLVFHTDIAPANLPIGADGKVAEDAPGFMISDGDNLNPGASQSRILDLTQPGTYLFVCNLPGHFAAGMHTVVTVK